jgi:uncharacterized protein YjeT (DUF2065 family)
MPASTRLGLLAMLCCSGVGSLAVRAADLPRNDLRYDTGSTRVGVVVARWLVSHHLVECTEHISGLSPY